MDRVIPTDEKEREALRKDAELRKLLIDLELRELDARNARAKASANLIYTFYGAVNQTTVEPALIELGNWSRSRPGAPITIIFNSPGGYVHDGMALFDYLLHMRQLGHHVTTIAMGRAASMGGILLQAGDRRVIGPNAFLLIHEVSAGEIGTVSKIEDSLSYFKKLQEKSIKILTQRSKLTAATLRRRWKRQDWWLDAEEAKALGFADFVLGEEGSGSPALTASK